MKRNKLDVLFSLLVREAYNWTCQRCRVDFRSFKMNLHTSHLASRSIQKLRYDPRNVVSLCAKCHYYLEARPVAHSTWFSGMYPENYDWVFEHQHRSKRWRVGEKEQMYSFYRFQKKMLDYMRNNGYNANYKIVPWEERLYE